MSSENPGSSAEPATGFHPALGRFRSIQLAALSAAFLGYHLYCAAFGAPEAMIFRGTHLFFALVIAFVAFPLRAVPPVIGGTVDAVLVGLTVLTIGYVRVHYLDIVNRIVYVDRPSQLEIVLAFLLVGLIFEATRRVVGIALPIVGFAFLAYAYFRANISIPRLVEINYLTTEGIFGVAVGVSATFVVLFVFFGSLFERSGAGRLFTDLALAIAGRTTGGPAKVACMTSALFGSISGSSVANVVTTGAFTIPLMKRIGYRGHMAGAIEAVASTGGQLLPPIMGAAAFLMAEFLGTSYLNVAAMALAPAGLFYLSLFVALHLHARRNGLQGLPAARLPAAWGVLRAQGHLMIPIVVLVGTLFMGYSAPYAALTGIIAIPMVMLLRRSSRSTLSLPMVIEALSTAARNSLVVATACAVAGLIMSSIFITGLGIDFTQALVRIAGDQMFLALLMSMLAALVLGMGLPTAPAYIVQVALLIPAMINLGVQREAAHFFALYFSCLSAITPPVAIAVFAATAISGAGVWRTVADAAVLALPVYLIPFFFVYDPALLLQGEPLRIALAIGSAAIGVSALAASTMGFGLMPLRALERLLVAAAAVSLIAPGMATDRIGFAVLALWFAWHVVRSRSAAARA